MNKTEITSKSWADSLLSGGGVGDGTDDGVLLGHLVRPILEHLQILLLQNAQVWVVQVFGGERHLQTKRDAFFSQPGDR